MRKLAVAGKGGSGKTTISGTLARLIARQGTQVWAIDADSNPNLALTLGLSRTDAQAIAPVPRTILEERTDDTGARRVELGMPVQELMQQFGTTAPDGVRLVLMGRVGHAGAG